MESRGLDTGLRATFENFGEPDSGFAGGVLGWPLKLFEKILVYTVPY